MNKLLSTITPDWEFSGSIERIKNEFDGFLITGPGWYSKAGTWVLSVATEVAGNYMLLVFFDRDPREAFKAIALAPVKLLVKVKA